MYSESRFLRKKESLIHNSYKSSQLSYTCDRVEWFHFQQLLREAKASSSELETFFPRSENQKFVEMYYLRFPCCKTYLLDERLFKLWIWDFHGSLLEASWCLFKWVKKLKFEDSPAPTSLVFSGTNGLHCKQLRWFSNSFYPSNIFFRAWRLQKHLQRFLHGKTDISPYTAARAIHDFLLQSPSILHRPTWKLRC